MSDLKKISYADFGHHFVQQVVTAHRIGTEIESALESTIAGSIRKLPAGMIVVSYVFELRDITVDPMMERLPDISFLLGVLGDIRLDVEIFGVDLKFTLDVSIQLQIDVETYAPVILKLVPHPVTSKNIRIDVKGANQPSEALDKLMLVQPIVREQIVREVNARIADPKIREMATIDVLALVDKATSKPAGSTA